MSRLNSFLLGLCVVDVAAYLPGSPASLLTSDMDADVEPPRGDGMREPGPRDAGGKPLFHATLNAGKAVRRIDLKTSDGNGDARAPHTLHHQTPGVVPAASDGGVQAPFAALVDGCTPATRTDYKSIG